MKTNRRLYYIACTALFILCCLQAPLAHAGGMQITPLDEMSGTFFEYMVPEVNLLVYVPVAAGTEMLMDNPGQKAVQIADPDCPETFFVFFAIQDESLKGRNLKDMDSEGIVSVLADISKTPESLEYKKVADFLPGVTVLRVKEPVEGFYAEHLVALYDGWVLNMMAQRMGGVESFTQEEQTYQEDFLISALDSSNKQERLQHYALPGSSIALTVPDTMYMRLVVDDEDNKELYVSPVRPGAQASILHLFAVSDPTYQSHTVLTLSELDKQNAMAYPTFTGAIDTESLTVWKRFEQDVPVLTYESDGTVKHMLAIYDGWALYVSIYPIADFIDPTWVQSVQATVMHQLLGGKNEIPDWLPAYPIKQEGSMLKYPLQSRIIKIAIPDGYGVDIARDTSDGRDVFLYALNGSPNYYHIASISAPKITGEASLDMYTNAEQQELCKSVSESIGSMGLAAESKMIAKGPAGVAAVYTTTKELTYEQYFWTMDSNSISFSFSSEDDAITEAESAALQSLIME